MGKTSFSVRVLLTVVSLAMVLTLFTLTGEASDSGVIKIAGQDRFETSAKVAAKAYDKVDTVIITRGDDNEKIADGLAASVLAGVLDAPILITRQDSLPSVIASKIDELEAKEAILLGGPQAVSYSVEQDLRNKGLKVSRIAGNTRIETAALIAKEAKEYGELGDFAFIVNGYQPADFMVAGPAIVENNAPILQVTENWLPDVTKETIKALDIKSIYIVGGSAVVSDALERELSHIATVKRFSGENRHDTSVEVAKAMYPDAIDYCMVGGHNYADAIGVGVLGKPILYISTSVIEDYLEQKLTSESLVTIVGGEKVADNGTVQEIQIKIDPDKAEAKMVSRQRTSSYGEYLDWYLVRDIYRVGTKATVTDVSSGLKFNVLRRGGTNHADSEPATAEDTAIMHRIYGGSWSWSTRAIIVSVGDRDIAASMNGMPHGGQNIYNNNFPGHFCIHFKNSRNHNTNSINPYHQASVKRAAGLK